MENQTRYSELLEQSVEKRQMHRQRVLKTGVILFNNGYSSFACKVKNLSEKGAMLEFDNTLGIPSEFKFRMGGTGSSFNAKAIWRSDQKMGIARVN